MSKLLQLKKYLSLQEAADYLSATLQEPVSSVGVLRLALDGHLTLSVDFVNHSRVTYGEKKSFDRAEFVALPRLFGEYEKANKLLEGFPRDGGVDEQHEWMMAHREAADHPDILLMYRGDVVEDGVLCWEDEISSIKGVWDIPTVGGAILDVEHAYQMMIGGPEVTLHCLDGAFVVSPDGSRYARLMNYFGDNEAAIKSLPLKDQVSIRQKFPYGEPSSFYPAAGLPDDVVMVVRPSSLAALVDRLSDDPVHRPQQSIDKRREKSLLRVVRALAEMSGLKRGASAAVVKQLELLGLDGPNDDTVRSILREASAIDSKPN